MKILIYDNLTDSLFEKLKQYGEVSDNRESIRHAEIIVLRGSCCDKQLIDGASSLRLIVRGGVGIDTIDTAYAESMGILVRNTPYASAIAVAELAFCLMLDVASKLNFFENSMDDGLWLKDEKRSELFGKTLCLVGVGNIAREVAIRANAFGMHVVGYDNRRKEQPFATMVSSLEEAVCYADYISLHVPLTEQTQGMINRQLLSCCKKQPVIINTSRALVVNAEDISYMLQKGCIAWYATDVYPSDPPSSDYCLLHAEHVTLTPHVGANTYENLERVENEVVEVIGNFITCKES